MEESINKTESSTDNIQNRTGTKAPTPQFILLHPAYFRSNFLPTLHYADCFYIIISSKELTQVDLESAVTNYLLDAGMPEDDILTLKTKLS